MKITTDSHIKFKKFVLCHHKAPRLYIWISEDRAEGREVFLSVNDALIIAKRNKFVGVFLLPESLHVVKVCRNHHGSEPVIGIDDIDLLDKINAAIGSREQFALNRNTHKDLSKEGSVTA